MRGQVLVDGVNAQRAITSWDSPVAILETLLEVFTISMLPFAASRRDFQISTVRVRRQPIG